MSSRWICLQYISRQNCKQIIVETEDSHVDARHSLWISHQQYLNIHIISVQPLDAALPSISVRVSGWWPLTITYKSCKQRGCKSISSYSLNHSNRTVDRLTHTLNASKHTTSFLNSWPCLQLKSLQSAQLIHVHFSFVFSFVASGDDNVLESISHVDWHVLRISKMQQVTRLLLKVNRH
jgi:hypothetical protein